MYGEYRPSGRGDGPRCLYSLILDTLCGRSPLKDFPAKQPAGARRYDRIAGFFSSSLLEVAGEALEQMTPDAVRRYRSAQVTKYVAFSEQSS